MARKLRYKPENVCYHVVTRVAHRDFMFDDADKSVIVTMIRKVEAFTGVNVLTYTVMSNHIHLLLFVDKPRNLLEWENVSLYASLNFEAIKKGDVYQIGATTFNQKEVDEIKRLRGMSIFERYEITLDELKTRMRTLMRPQAYDELMEQWARLSDSELYEEYERQFVRMYDLSEFMKILKQNITQCYNYSHDHVGGLWEGRYKDSIIQRSMTAMSAVATYIDLNAWRAKMVSKPSDYSWCGWHAAILGDNLRRQAYKFIYDTNSIWSEVEASHRQTLQERMDKDNIRQGEIEEKVFTSGGIIGSSEFVKGMVKLDGSVFPKERRSSPVDAKIGNSGLKVLRNLAIIR